MQKYGARAKATIGSKNIILIGTIKAADALSPRGVIIIRFVCVMITPVMKDPKIG